MEENNSNQLATLQGFSMFQRPPKTGIKYFDEPVKIKFNCAGKGQMTDSQDNHIGNTMKMIVLNNKKMHASLFKYDPTIWQEIIFVDERDTVCVTLIKGESLTHFQNCLRNIYLGDLAIAEATITAKFASRTNSNNQSYSVVEFSWEKTADERTSLIAEFVKKNPLVMVYSYLDELTQGNNRHEREDILDEDQIREKD